MAFMNPIKSQDTLFLEPPHSHDPTQVSHIAALPYKLIIQLPLDIQDSFWALQESTSVLYASYIRLQSMLEERFERLARIDLGSTTGDIQYSESAFFTYVNAVVAERRYIVEDVFPDWKHKASRIKLDDYANLPLTFCGTQTTISQWFDRLQKTVGYWAHEAVNTPVPDFNETVTEWQALSSPGSEGSEDDAGIASQMLTQASVAGTSHCLKPVAVEPKPTFIPQAQKRDSGIEIED